MGLESSLGRVLSPVVAAAGDAVYGELPERPYVSKIMLLCRCLPGLCKSVDLHVLEETADFSQAGENFGSDAAGTNS